MSDLCGYERTLGMNCLGQPAQPWNCLINQLDALGMRATLGSNRQVRNGGHGNAASSNASVELNERVGDKPIWTQPLKGGCLYHTIP
jgi:hypothetical protein